MGDPICPFAVQHILHGEEDRRPTIIPIGTALHTAVTTADGDSLGRYFDGEAIKTDSTAYVDRDGSLYQFSPVTRKANAQFAGNSFTLGTRLFGIVSTETWDGGDPAKPLNAKQLTTLNRWYAWLHDEHAIPLDLSTRWNGPGAGWHSKYPEWNHNRHACPGPVRIEQLVHVILPAARQLVAGTFEVGPPVYYPEDNMRSIPMKLPTDGQGNGYVDVAAAIAKVASVTTGTVNPPSYGYKPVPTFGLVAVTAASTRVVAAHGPAHAKVDITVWVVD